MSPIRSDCFLHQRSKKYCKCNVSFVLIIILYNKRNMALRYSEQYYSPDLLTPVNRYALLQPRILSEQQRCQTLFITIDWL